MILPPRQLRLFDWKSLKSEMNTLIDAQGSEKRLDLLFSVKIKGSRKKAKIMLLVEHKSYKTSHVLKQMLGYQAVVYERQDEAILPILFYHGKDKNYKGPLTFQDSLNDFPKDFKKNVLNFTCLFVNLQSVNLGRKTARLISNPILYILKEIWSLDEKVIENLFQIAQEVGDVKKRSFMMDRAMDYVNKKDPRFTLKKLAQIEERIVTDEKERIMPPLQYSLDREREKGLKKGRREGLEEGIVEGIAKGLHKAARKMLQEGLDLEMVCKYTDLSMEEVKKLLKENS